MRRTSTALRWYDRPCYRGCSTRCVAVASVCIRASRTAWCLISAATCCATGRSIRFASARSCQQRQRRGTGQGMPPVSGADRGGLRDLPMLRIRSFRRPIARSMMPKPSEAGILSGQVTDADYEVQDVTYSVHTKRERTGGRAAVAAGRVSAGAQSLAEGVHLF